MLRTGLGKVFSFCRWGLRERKARGAAKRPSTKKAWSFEQLEGRDFLSASGLLVATSSVLQSTQPTANPHQNVVLLDYVYGTYASGHNATSASGNVNYYDNGNYLGAANLVSTPYGYSVATLNTSNLTSGSHTIRAAFGGMGNFLASSATTTEFITTLPAQTTNSLSLSSPASTFGQSLTITDSVFASYYAGTPYGSVSFYDNGSLLGTVSLSNYGFGIAEAKLTTSSLYVGQHSISAVYGGSTGFQASSAATNLPVHDLPVPSLTPGESFTYQQEGGALTTPYNPRVAGSGVTIGVGYDLGQHTAQQIQADLKAVGVAPQTVAALSAEAGVTDPLQVQAFANSHTTLALSPSQAMNLYVNTYTQMALQVEDICASFAVVAKYGATNWNALNQRIKDVLVDMIYRGDYNSTTRQFFQADVAADNLSRFISDISNRNEFASNLTQLRLQARINYAKG
jgi:hypothetical protein